MIPKANEKITVGVATSDDLYAIRDPNFQSNTVGRKPGINEHPVSWSFMISSVLGI